MRLKFLSFSNLTLLVALSLSSVAAWYSIIGLTAIFAGAVIPVIIMGSILEVGKITTTVWLHKYWHRASWVLKLYLVPAVIALALLTSMGIFGFLSKAHMDQGITSGDSQAKLSLYDEKIKTQRDNIELARKALTQMDNQVDQRLSRGDSENSAERAVQIRRQQAGERTKLQKEIGDAQKEIAKLNEERAPIAAENRKIEAEVGPIKYIAALIYGDTTDNNTLESAVRWVIILLVIVFDPLAIALVLAANASKKWDEEPKEEQKPDDVVDNLAKEEVAEIEKIEEVEELKPIKFVDHGEHPKDHDEKTVKEPIVEEQLPEPDLVQVPKLEKSIFEQHPYLLQPFDHVKNLKPMVYKKEVIVDEPIKDLEEENPKKKRPVPRMTVKQKTDILIEEPIVEEPVIDEITADAEIKIEDMHTMEVKQDLPFKELPGGYVSFEGKHMNKDVLFNMHPEFLRLSADASKPVNSSFGTKFPDIASKGDIFTRVDVLPNKVYKFDGGNWININKETSNTYLYNTKYLDYLIEVIGKGEYDPELLSENEKSQIEDYLKINKINQNR
jgi:hypothetical protein